MDYKAFLMNLLPNNLIFIRSIAAVNFTGHLDQRWPFLIDFEG